MSLITQIMNEETRWLARQEGAVLSDMLDIYKGTIAEIKGEISGLDQLSYSHNQARAIQSQLEAKVAGMERRMAEALGKTTTTTYKRQMTREKTTLAKLEKTFGDAFMSQQFRGFTPIVPQRSIKKLITTQGIAIKGLSDQVTKDVRKLGIARSLTRGEGTAATVKRLQKMDLPLRKGRVHLIARMETARAGNEAKSETLRQVGKEFNIDLWQMFKDHVERSAKTRNHWISWALSGTVRNTSKGEYFEIHHAELSATKADYARITGRTAKDTGILMASFSKGRRTKGGVAHFWERGNIVPWRPKWGQTFGPVKHPQGPITEMKKKDSIVQDDSEAAYLKREADKKATEDGKKPTAVPPAKTVAVKDIPERPSADDVLKFKTKHADDWGLINTRARELAKRIDNLSITRDEAVELLGLVEKAKRITDDIHAVIKAPKAAQITPVYRMRFKDPEFKRDLQAGVDFVSDIIGPGRIDGLSFEVKRAKSGRASYGQGVVSIGKKKTSVETSATMAHEVAHWVEEVMPGALEKATDFWERRTAGETEQSMRRLTGINYGKDELTRKDQFLTPYMGKVYYSNPRPKGVSWQRPHRRPGQPEDKYSGTELVSMGLELLYKDPLYLMQDEDYFRFIWELVTDV